MLAKVIDRRRKPPKVLKSAADLCFCIFVFLAANYLGYLLIKVQEDQTARICSLCSDLIRDMLLLMGIDSNHMIR